MLMDSLMMEQLLPISYIKKLSMEELANLKLNSNSMLGLHTMFNGVEKGYFLMEQKKYFPEIYPPIYRW